MTTTTTTLHRLRVSDVSQQKNIAVSDIALDLSVGEFIDCLVPRLQMPSHDSAGRPLEYHARLEREGRHLHRSERLDVLQEDDEIVLQPNVDAGLGAVGIGA